MRVLVTGAAGLIGKETTKSLIRQGFEVRGIDVGTDVELPDAEYVTCDVTNYDDLRAKVRGCQAIIHLAAIARPSLAPGETVFRVNTSGTFNVFEAAASEGIKRVVQASSINALGVSFTLTDIVTEYFPVDEKHPTHSTDPYSLSKQIVEEIGAYYWRRDGISSVALRFPGVRIVHHAEDAQFITYATKARAMIDELTAQPADEREARLAAVRQRALDWRKQRPMEYHMEYRVEKPAPLSRNTPDDIFFHIYAVDRWNLWAAVDVRDTADALVQGLTANYEGAHPLFISDAHNWLGYDSRALIRMFFPHIGDEKIALTGTDSLLDIKQAQALIGYAPKYPSGIRSQTASTT